MKKVTVSAVCDRCGEDVLDGDPGNGILAALGQSRAVEVDLCDACLANAHSALDSAIAAGVRPLRQSRGNGSSTRPPRGNFGRREQVSCPLCDKSVAVGAGQVLHARKVHGLEREQVWELQPA